MGTSLKALSSIVLKYLAKLLSVHLQTKWLWFRIQFRSLKMIDCHMEHGPDKRWLYYNF